jgi:hypothetical protein
VALGSVVTAVFGPVIRANGFATEAEGDDVPGFEGVVGEGA